MKKFVVIMVTVLGLQVAANSGAATLTVVHSFGPDTTAFQADFVEKLATGTVPDGIATSASDARRVQVLVPEHVMVKGDGMGYIWVGAILTAGPGETVSLHTITATLRSTETGDPGRNRLGKTVSFSGSSYSPTAPGIPLNGPRITSGDPDQTVDGKVVVLIGYLSLPASTASVQQDVQNWFYSNNVTFTSTVSATGATTSTLVLRSSAPPNLTAVITADNTFRVIAENNGDPRNYEVEVASLVNGPWASTGSTLRAGFALDFGPVSAYPARFVRLVSP